MLLVDLFVVNYEDLYINSKLFLVILGKFGYP